MKPKEIGNVVIAVRKDNKYLLLRRSENETNPGIWEFPAGKIEDTDASPLDAAVRELKEETDIPSKTTDLKYTGLTYRPKTQGIVKSYLFSMEIDNKEAEKIKLSSEHNKIKFLSPVQLRNHQNTGFETIRCLNKIDANKLVNNFIVKLGKEIKKKYSDNHIGVMLVGSAARDDFLTNWSDFDVVVFFPKNNIQLSDLYKLRKINEKMNLFGHQTWFKVHCKKDFPNLYEKSMALNYFNDGRHIFGIDIKKILKQNFNKHKKQIINYEAKKNKNFHWSPRFFFRYFMVGINRENTGLSSLHIENLSHTKNPINPDKIRIAKLIDSILDNSYQLLFKKNFIPSCDKFLSTSLFYHYFGTDIPFRMLEKRERLWHLKTIPENEIREIEKMSFEFFEHIYPMEADKKTSKS